MVVFFRWIIHLKKKNIFKKKLQTSTNRISYKTNKYKQTATNRHHLLASKTKKNIEKSRAPLRLRGLCIHLWSGGLGASYLVRVGALKFFPWVHRQTPGKKLYEMSPKYGIHFKKIDMSSSKHQFLDVSFRKGI